MSCSSTPASSAAVSAACFAEPSLTRSQVQSLFHKLKREGAEEGMSAPSEQDYQDGLDKLQFRVRSSRDLSESAKRSILARIETARTGEVPDAAMWHAIEEIGNQTSVAAFRLEERYLAVSRDFGVPVEKVEAVFQAWRDSDGSMFEDKAAPDRKFRYDLDPAVPSDEGTSRALRKLGYEHYLIQPYPVFVYGTLRQGQHNHVLMDGAVEKVSSARVNGVGVYGASYGFPYAAEHADPESVVVGDIVWLSSDDAGDTARERLDWLEGFDSDAPSNSHYERVLMPVTVTSGHGVTATVPAWMYLARGDSRLSLREEDRIKSGDWVSEKEKFQVYSKYR